MKIILILFYNLLWLIVYILMFPYILIKRKTIPGEWEERLGIYNFDYSGNDKCVWIHGASLGEITAASQLAMRIKEKYPRRKIVISSMTVTGKERAMRIMKGMDNFVLLPFDFFPLVRKCVKRINPEVLILIETEIWPSLIFYCRKRGIKIILANGRLSDRTFRRYLKLRYISQRLFNQIDIFFPQSKEEEQKFLKLGIKKFKIKVIGSLKSDNSSPIFLERSSFSIPSHKSVIVAGSVRKGEEEIIIKGFKALIGDFNETYLIIAPRHLSRVGDIENLLRKENLGYKKRTDGLSYNGESVLILDTIGELRNVYSVGDIAFIGGTLLPYGGHNLVEPAFFGLPILFGPYINNTRESAIELIKSGSAIIVANETEFKKTISNLLDNPSKRKKMGENSKQYIKQKSGVVKNYIEALAENSIL